MGFQMLDKLRDASLPLPPGCVVRHDLTCDTVQIALDRGHPYFHVFFAAGSRCGHQILATRDAVEAERLYEEIVREVQAGRFKVYFHGDGRETIEFLSQDITQRIGEARGRK